MKRKKKRQRKDISQGSLFIYLFIYLRVRGTEGAAIHILGHIIRTSILSCTPPVPKATWFFSDCNMTSLHSHLAYPVLVAHAASPSLPFDVAFSPTNLTIALIKVGLFVPLFFYVKSLLSSQIGLRPRAHRPQVGRVRQGPGDPRVGQPGQGRHDTAPQKHSQTDQIILKRASRRPRGRLSCSTPQRSTCQRRWPSWSTPVRRLGASLCFLF